MGACEFVSLEHRIVRKLRGAAFEHQTLLEMGVPRDYSNDISMLNSLMKCLGIGY